MYLPARLETRTRFKGWVDVSRKFLYLCALVAFASAAAQAPSAAPAPPAPAAPQPLCVVVVDASHGGDDAGGRLANSQPEKALTLAMSVRLRSLLAARGIQALTVREQDATIDLN